MFTRRRTSFTESETRGADSQHSGSSHTVTDGLSYASYKIQIVNGAGLTAANLTNFVAFQAAH
jgi:copper homeostasis protein CutC